MTITAKNYAAQCALSLKRDPCNFDREEVHEYVRLVESAQHFVLPDGGRLFDDNLKGLKHGAVETTPPRLPYPVTTIEYYQPLGDPATLPPGLRYCNKRLALLVEEQALPASMRARAQGAGFIVLAFSRFADNGQWVPALLGAAVNDEIWPWLTETEDTGSGGTRMRMGVFNYLALPHEYAHVVAKYAARGESAEKCFTESAGDSASEIRAALDFLEAMSCVNVGTAIHQAAPSNKVAHARRRDGKAPIYETKMLVVDVRGDEPRAIGAPQGDRAGVRQHLRRGHIRRLQSGRNIWVNSHVVGDPSLGRVDKQYRVHA